MSKNPLPETRESISEMTTGRLSVYLRCLTYLEQAGKETVSSQIRKDLACFGEFGTRGVGYNVKRLKEQLVHTLGIDRKRNVLIVGAGNLGMALADYRGFNHTGFEIVALVDSDPDKAGRESRSGIPVLPSSRLADIVRENAVEIGVIAVPAEGAQEAHDALVAAGVVAVLNFAPVQIRTPQHVKVKTVDLRINLESLSFFLKNIEDGTF
jgi:redox-sensing transcriptional repressor